MTNPLGNLHEPVRLYGVAAAALALAAHYFEDLPVALILGLVAALLGVGEMVRGTVTPEKHFTVIESAEDAFALLEGLAPDDASELEAE